MVATILSGAEATRASQALFEANVDLPLTTEQARRVAQLDFFKRWYLLCHAVYMGGTVVLGTVVLYFFEPQTNPVDVFFVAMSTACNCGLQTIDVGQWHDRTNWARRVFMLLGGVVLTSSYQPLLRMLMLFRVRAVFDRQETDSPSQARTRTQKRRCADRLWRTSLLCAITPLIYFACVVVWMWLALWLFNTSSLSAVAALAITLDSFHGCVFSSMEAFADDGIVVGLVALACALGFTAFPVVLRTFMRLEWTVLRVFQKVWPHITLHASLSAPRTPTRGGVFHRGDEDGHPEEQRILLESDDADDEPDVTSAVGSVWDNAFQEVLSSKHGGSFHPFLFQRSETAYLGCAWLALTCLQAAPFWFQQWGHVLAPFSLRYKIYVSICQAAVVRFAAASFVPLREFTNAHVAVTILAMYLPALPISTDRTYRKWKQMFRTSVVRLLTSRLFWLFAAMVSVIFASEPHLGHRLYNTRFDMMTRTFFEVISAYSGCGLSLSLPSAPEVSFSGATGTFSKLVIAAVLFGGRHRFVDLGYDLGLGTLESQPLHSP